MGEQLEIFEEILEQLSSAQNVGVRDPRTKGWHKLSPGLLHAKVAREAALPPTVAENAPVDSAEASRAVPAVPRVITTREELLDLLRRRRVELGITLEALDNLTGWAERLASKLFSPEPTKQLGEQSLRLVLQALALGIVQVTIVEDPELLRRMQPRWPKRRRPPMRTRRTRSQLSGALLDDSAKPIVASTPEEGANGS